MPTACPVRETGRAISPSVRLEAMPPVWHIARAYRVSLGCGGLRGLTNVSSRVNPPEPGWPTWGARRNEARWW